MNLVSDEARVNDPYFKMKTTPYCVKNINTKYFKYHQANFVLLFIKISVHVR